jgi:hypothetical protein
VYQELFVMPSRPSQRRSLRAWTMREVAQLRLWRTQSVPIPECARRLGRSVSSVLGQATRQRIFVQAHYPDGRARPLIRQLVQKGYTDAGIARLIGRTKRTVRHHRREMGLAPNTRKHRRKPKPRPECWACGAVCPKDNNIASVGWVARLYTVRGLTETYCKACFEEWGWPPELA